MLRRVSAVDTLLSRITITPGTRSGQPCIRDLRITVWDILRWLENGASHARIPSDLFSTPTAKRLGTRANCWELKRTRIRMD